MDLSLNMNQYYTPMLSLFDHMIEQEFVKEPYKNLILIDDDSTNLIEKLKNYKAEYIHKW